MTRQPPSGRCSTSAAHSRVRLGGEERLIAAEDVGRYRDALGAIAALGRARRPSSSRCPTRCASAAGALRAPARAVHDAPTWPRATPSTRASPSASSSALERREHARARRDAARRRSGASGATPRCCAASAARRSRACAARSRRSSPPALARFALPWHGVERGGARRRRAPARRARPAAAAAAGARGLGARRPALPRARVPPGAARRALHERRARLAGRRARGGSRSRFREDAALLGPPPGAGAAPAERAAAAVRAALLGARAPRRARRRRPASPEPRSSTRSGDLAAAGEVDERRLGAAAAPRGARRRRRTLTRRRARAGCARRRSRRAAPRSAAGASTAPLLRRPVDESDRPARSGGAAARAPRRAHARRRRRRGRSRRLLRRSAARCGDLETLGACAARLPRRGPRRRAVRAAGRGRAPARRARSGSPTRARSSLAASDPANPYGVALPLAGARRRPRLARGRRDGRAAQTASRSRSSSAAAARCSRCAELEIAGWRGRWPRRSRGLARGRVRSLRLERIDGEAASRHAGRRGVHGRRVRRGPPAPGAARAALTLPEGHTLELAARRMAPLVGGAWPPSSPPTRRLSAWPRCIDGRAARIRRGARQAPAGGVRQRPRPPLPPAHDRGLARLSRRRAWARSPRNAWLALSADGLVAVQFGGPVLELLDLRASRCTPRSAPRARRARRPIFDRPWRSGARARAAARGRSARSCSIRPWPAASATSCAARRCTHARIDPWAPARRASPTRRSPDSSPFAARRRTAAVDGGRAPRRCVYGRQALPRAAAARCAAAGRVTRPHRALVPGVPGCLQVVQYVLFVLHR